MDYQDWEDEIARSGWSFGLSTQKEMLADWRTDRAEWRASRDKWKAEAERLKTVLENLKQNDTALAPPPQRLPSTPCSIAELPTNSDP
jgi:hypothetical protein